MQNFVRAAVIALSLASASCVSYSSIHKASDGIYLSGNISYLVTSVPFLKRCTAEGQVLRCEELKEFDTKRASSGPAPAPAVASTAPTAEETKAPAQ